MEKIKRNLIKEDFIENTTFHGVYYFKQTNKHVKIFWFILLLILSAMILISTTLMLVKYLSFDYYLTTEERVLDELETIPDLLVCSSDQLSLTSSIAELKPEYEDIFKKVRNAQFDFQNVNNSRLDQSTVNELKQIMQNSSKYSLKSCEISVESQTIQCLTYTRKVIFTLSGFCLLIDFQQLKADKKLLSKEKNYLNYYKDYKLLIKIKLRKLDQNEKLYFQLVEENLFEYSNRNGELVYNEYGKLHSLMTKSYDVMKTSLKYSDSLYNKKCMHKSRQDFLTLFEHYTQDLCEYECLIMIIKNQLKCKFTLNPQYNDSMSYCTVAHLVYIEEIISSYAYFKENLNICKPCLPDCESIKFLLKESFDGSSESEKMFIWKFYLNFKTYENKYQLKLENTELINFINGLWSLFLGISILSFWELFELTYALRSSYCCFTKKFKQFRYYWRTSIMPIPTIVEKFYKILSSLFLDTYLHGFKNVFTNCYSTSTKLRWMLVLIAITVWYCMTTRDAIVEYTRYDSDYVTKVQLIDNNEGIGNRKVTLFMCLPLYLANGVKKKEYDSMYRLANSLFKKNISFDEIIAQYKIQSGIDFSQLNNNKTSMLKLYSSIFQREIYEVELDYGKTFVKKSLLANYYYDKMCAYLPTNITVDDWKIVQSVRINIAAEDYAFMGISFRISEDYYLQISVLDTESMFISENSYFMKDVQEEIYKGNYDVFLRQKKLLATPFKPSCNPKKSYDQNECYRDCFNALIYEKFGCKVIFNIDYKTINEPFCHPWILPLIFHYEKYHLKNEKINRCRHQCQEPCEFFYYEIKQSSHDVEFSKPGDNLKINSYIETTEQLPIRTLEGTVIVIISYFSFFYGGSLLALVQLLFNLLATNIKSFNKDISLIKIEKLLLVDRLSKLTTVHGLRYLSSSIKNEIWKIFWILIIFLTLMVCVIYTKVEIGTFYESNLKSLTVKNENEADLKVFKEFKIDVCHTLSSEDSEKIYPFNSDDDLSITMANLVNNLVWSIENSYFSNIREQIQFKLDDLGNSLKNISLQFKSIVFSIDNYRKLDKLKWSTQLGEFIKRNLNGIQVSNGILQSSSNLTYNSTTRIYESSMLFNKNGFEVDICKSFKWQTFAINSAKFIKLEENQLSVKNEMEIKNLYPRTYVLYFQNYLLDFTKSYNSHSRHYKQIKSFYNDFNYKFNCQNKESCINNKKVLFEYSEHELFLCNNQLKEAIYDAFNCTPFMLKSARVPECSIPYTILISAIMAKYSSKLFRCEVSNEKFPVEYDDVLIPENKLKYITGIDLNGVTIYKQDIIQEYSLLQLILNLSNFFNVLIGFSFVTICELVFIFIYYRHNSAKISPHH